ncbi:MAG: DUF1311 domain-containing protein [Burkholderiales bacterium]|nr:MAG: DUF1311 domain-containing protein [Burkholderiales bacterium]
MLADQRSLWQKSWGLKLVACVLAVMSCWADAASFDCGKARGEAERAICADPTLSKIDEELAKQYKDALKLMGNGGARFNAFRANQAAWLKERARCGGTLPCLSELMKDRIDWMLSPLHQISGEYSSDRLSIVIVHNGNTHKPLVRIYGSRKPSDQTLMGSELQAKWVSAQANKLDGEDSVQVTPMWHAPHRALDGQCSALRLNFGSDGLLNLIVNPGCPLLKSSGGSQSLEFRFVKPDFMSASSPR